jgi:hypothetical protein
MRKKYPRKKKPSTAYLSRMFQGDEILIRRGAQIVQVFVWNLDKSSTLPRLFRGFGKERLRWESAEEVHQFCKLHGDRISDRSAYFELADGNFYLVNPSFPKGRVLETKHRSFQFIGTETEDLGKRIVSFDKPIGYVPRFLET